jgi:phage gp29-like protein
MTPNQEAITVINPQWELPSIIREMTADRLMAVIAQAENGDTRDLFALYRDIISSDNHIQGEFGKRKAAVLGDNIAVLPYDKTSPADIETKDICSFIEDSKLFAQLQQHLLNATLYPVAVAEKVYRVTASGYTLDKIVPIPYQLLDYTNGLLKIYDTDTDGRPLTTSHEPDPARYIIHRGHVMPIPDTWGGPFRSILFWWLLRTMSRQWWANFIERFGIPFMLGKFDTGDTEGKNTLTNAFRMAVRLGGLVISKKTEAELIQASTGDTSGSHESFINLCNREISRLIVGQDLSGQSSPTGELGGGTAKLQGEVRDDIRKMDARLLSLTIRDGLLSQICQINGKVGRVPVILFGSDSAAELASVMSLVKGLSDAQLEPDDDGLQSLSTRVGFGIRRRAASSQITPFSIQPLSAPNPDALEVGPVPADLLKMFKGRYEKVADIIRTSESPEDCIKQVREWATKSNVSDVATLLEQALTVYAYKGATSE